MCQPCSAAAADGERAYGLVPTSCVHTMRDRRSADDSDSSAHSTRVGTLHPRGMQCTSGSPMTEVRWHTYASTRGWSRGSRASRKKSSDRHTDCQRALSTGSTHTECCRLRTVTSDTVGGTATDLARSGRVRVPLPPLPPVPALPPPRSGESRARSVRLPRSAPRLSRFLSDPKNSFMMRGLVKRGARLSSESAIDGRGGTSSSDWHVSLLCVAGCCLRPWSTRRLCRALLLPLLLFFPFCSSLLLPGLLSSPALPAAAKIRFTLLGLERQRPIGGCFSCFSFSWGEWEEGETDICPE
mmetsp:Transcript_30805/g.77307  ORF Transcript_30805/g.77307 Transcript_30805/m.77307 type:complete len:298 (+) Transcript_30805:1299-2192(+)